jgi:hypothetical protein
MTSLDKVAAVLGALLAQPALGAEYRAPRNEYGQPDLRGVWNFSSDVPLERPKEFADKDYRTREDLDKANATRDATLERMTQTAGTVGAHNTFWLDYKAHGEDLRTSLISHPANGRLPNRVEGVQKIGGFAAAFKDIPGTRPVRFYFGGIGKDGPEDRGLGERCIVSEVGPPLIPGFDNNYIQIFQGRDHVVILNEQIHDARTVPLDGRAPVDGELRAWLGYSRGRWEGDTLVVETSNFNDFTPSFDNSGTAYHKTVTERFTRTADGKLNYAVTLVDPKTFQDRIEFSFPMTKTDHRIYEFACHEGNYSMDMILRGARKEERDAP